MANNNQNQTNEQIPKTLTEIQRAIVDLLKNEHACFQSEIERRLPFGWREIKEARENLSNHRLIRFRSVSFHPRSKEMKIYFLPTANATDLLETVSKKAKLLASLSDAKFTSGLGDFGIDVAIRALQKFKFSIRDKKAIFFDGIRLNRQEDGDLDVIAYKSNKFYCFEVKNRKKALDENEYTIHLARCKKVKLQPAFIVTRMIEEVKKKADSKNIPAIITGKQFVEHTPSNLSLVMGARKTFADEFYVLVAANKVPSEIEIPLKDCLHLFKP